MFVHFLTKLLFHNKGKGHHYFFIIRSRSFISVRLKPFELSPANSIDELVRWTTIVDAVEIRIMAIIVPPGIVELRSKVRIGTFVVLTIFGRKLHPTRNISESEKKIIDINCMSHPLS